MPPRSRASIKRANAVWFRPEMQRSEAESRIGTAVSFLFDTFLLTRASQVGVVAPHLYTPSPHVCSDVRAALNQACIWHHVRVSTLLVGWVTTYFSSHTLFSVHDTRHHRLNAPHPHPLLAPRPLIPCFAQVLRFWDSLRTLRACCW